MLVVASIVSAQPSIREQQTPFKKREAGATVRGGITGGPMIDCELRAGAGQSMVVIFKPGDPSAKFDILPPGSDEALFVGSSSGNRCEVDLPAHGV